MTLLPAFSPNPKKSPALQIGLALLVSVHLKNERLLLISGMVALFSMRLTSLVIYKCHFYNWFDTLLAQFAFESGFATLALNTPNNRWLLGLWLLVTISYPLWAASKEGRWTYFVQLLALFGVWNHSKMREDASHIIYLPYFMPLFSGMIALAGPSRWPRPVLAGVVSLLLLLFHAQGIYNFNLTPFNAIPHSAPH